MYFVFLGVEPASVWNADHMYEGNVEDMFYNVMLAYYLACSNVAMLTQQHGSNDWTRFSFQSVPS